MDAASDPAAFDTFLGELESYYEPPWSVYRAVADRVGDATLVCDFGCGTGRLARHLAECQPTLAYIGLDRDEQRLSYARTASPASARFTVNSDDFATQAAASARTVFVAGFCVHDQPSLDDVQRLIERISPAAILVWDLTPHDLPRLGATLRAHAITIDADPRQRPLELAHALEKAGRHVETSTQSHAIAFPSADAITTYIDTFALLEGADMGISAEDQGALEAVLLDLPVPFRDQRHFIEIWAH